MGGRRHGLRCVTAPALDFGILTETKDGETATVESSFTVTSAYTAEDFVSDTRSAFLACVTEDFGEQVASEAASLVDGQKLSIEDCKSPVQALFFRDGMLYMPSIPSRWPNDLSSSPVLSRRLLAEKDRFIEPTCCGHVRLVDKMAVGVDGGLDGPMAQHPLNIL